MGSCPTDKPDEVQLQVAALTEQVAALSISLKSTQSSRSLLVVFTVIKWGMCNVTAAITNALTVGD